MFLGSNEIRKLILNENMVSGYEDLDTQLQPDGFDLRLDKLEMFMTSGTLLKDRKILPIMSELKTKSVVYPYVVQPSAVSKLPVVMDDKVSNVWDLEKGVYLAHICETIRLPKSISSVHIQRSTLMRCGSDVAIGTWDMGYNGKGFTLLEVKNPHGLTIEQGARFIKMQFVPVTEGKLYNGSYQNENIQKICKKLSIDSSIVEQI